MTNPWDPENKNCDSDDLIKPIEINDKDLVFEDNFEPVINTTFTALPDSEEYLASLGKTSFFLSVFFSSLHSFFFALCLTVSD